MKLDIRFPLGLMFAIIGGLLTLTGVTRGGGAAGMASGININLWWGLVILVFGALTLWLSKR